MKLAAATPGPSSRPRMGCFTMVATAASGLFVMSTVVSVGMKGAKSVIRRRQVCPPACHHGVTCSPAAHTLALQPQRHCHYGMFSEQPVVLQMAHATTCSTCSGRKTIGCDICRGAAPLRGLRVVSGGYYLVCAHVAVHLRTAALRNQAAVLRLPRMGPAANDKVTAL